MKDKYEVLVSSDTSGALGVWDPSTGNCLHQYKGGVTRANTLTWIKQVSRNFSLRSYIFHFPSPTPRPILLTESSFFSYPHFQDWLLSAPPDTPLLNVWLGSKAEQAPVRMFTPAPTQVKKITRKNS